GLLQMIAGSVGQDGAYYLLELSHHSDEGVVNAAVQAMAGLPKDQTLIDRLGQIAEHDPNEAVREHATQALLNWADGPDLADKVWKLKAFDDGYRRMAMDWWGKHSPDEARIKALAILDDPDSEPLRTTAIEVLGRVKEKGASSAVYAALAPVAQETSYWSRLAAINALGALGNKSAIEVLEPFVTHGPQGIRGAAKAAIAQLRK
ncbi:MAG: HEAT repeat domain-containing protein, partial [Fimbriimonas ginsengisoli]|nr:HEAT repeat domain-containing protein [Fimbriimonas ginsengisoli]